MQYLGRVPERSVLDERDCTLKLCFDVVFFQSKPIGIDEERGTAARQHQHLGRNPCHDRLQDRSEDTAELGEESHQRHSHSQLVVVGQSLEESDPSSLDHMATLHLVAELGCRLVGSHMASLADRNWADPKEFLEVVDRMIAGHRLVEVECVVEPNTPFAQREFADLGCRPRL